MKGILEFNLDDPDDRREHLLATKAGDLALLVWQYEEDMRRARRGKIDLGTMSIEDFLVERFYELLSQHHIELDALVI